MVWKKDVMISLHCFIVVVTLLGLHVACLAEQLGRVLESGGGELLLHPPVRDSYPHTSYITFSRNSGRLRAPLSHYPARQLTAVPYNQPLSRSRAVDAYDSLPDVESLSSYRNPSSLNIDASVQLPLSPMEGSRLNVYSQFIDGQNSLSQASSNLRRYETRYAADGEFAYQRQLQDDVNAASKIHYPEKVPSSVQAVKDVITEEEMGKMISYGGLLGSVTTNSGDKKSTEDIHGAYSRTSKSGPIALRHRSIVPESSDKSPMGDIYFVLIVAGCSAAAIFGVIAAGFFFYRLQKTTKAAADVDYPAYGVTGPNKDHTSPNGDRKLAQSAQMFHYQHQKQQMIAVEKSSTSRHTSASDVDSDEENEEGDYTVYECPGLASTGEMEVKNPLFQDDSTPGSPSMTMKDKTAEK